MNIPQVLMDSPFGPDKIYLAARTYTMLLQAFFSNWERYKWDEDPSRTKIIIGRMLPYNPPSETKLPAVIVKTSVANWVASAPNPRFMEDPLGRELSREHIGMIYSAIGILCISTSDTEAALLGWNIFNLIPTLKEEIKHIGGFVWIDNRITISDIFDASSVVHGASPGQWFAVQLQSSYMLGQENCVITSPLLGNAIEKIKLELAKIDSKQ